MFLAGKKNKSEYFLICRNMICRSDKDMLEARLKQVVDSNREAIKRFYSEARKRGKDARNEGNGIGFYEISKRCLKIEHSFKSLSEDRFSFTIKTFF